MDGSDTESQRSTEAGDSEFGFFKQYSKASSARILRSLQSQSNRTTIKTNSSDLKQRNHMYDDFLSKTHTDVIVTISENLVYNAHRIVLASGSDFFRRKMKDWWRSKNLPETFDNTAATINVDLTNDIWVLFGEDFEELECKEVLDTIFRYLYTSEVDVELIDFNEWLCLVQVADYFAMDGLIHLLTDHFKSAFLIADTEIIANFQICLSYPFLHELCDDIGNFISSNLSKICESIQNLANESVNNSSGTSSVDYFDKLPLAVHESTSFFDDQVVPQVMKNENNCDISAIESSNQTILEPPQHQNPIEAQMGPIKYSTIFKILENNPNADDQTIFHFIVSWFSSKAEYVNSTSKKPASKRVKFCKSFFKPKPEVPKVEELQSEVIEQSITLLQRFIQKEFDGSSRSRSSIIEDLSVMKRQQGETDEQVFRHKIFDSPPKTPVKKFSLTYFMEEVQNNPCYQMWMEKGTESFRNYNKQKDMILSAWLGVPESPSMALNSFSIFQKSEKRITRAKRKLVMDEIKANTSFEIKEALENSVKLEKLEKYDKHDNTLKSMNDKPDSDVSTEIKPVKYRIPYQAPLVVGSWAGRNEDEENYGPSSNAHIWNHSKDEWTTNPEGFKMPENICYNGCAFIEPYLYIYGGYDGNRENSHGIANAWKCNMETLTWEPIPPINIRRLYIAGTNMGDQSCLAIGGSSGRTSREIKDYINEMNDKTFINESGRMRAVEQYIIKENRWRRLPNMIEHRSDASACCHNDLIFVAGGFNGKQCLNSAEIYNPDEHLWTQLPNLHEKRSGLSLIIYQNNLLAMCGFGGREQNAEDGERRRKKRHRTVECLKLDEDGVLPDQQYWKLLPARLNEGRSNFGACVINDNQIVVCGGFNEGTLKSSEKWTGSIEKVASTRYSEYETDYERTRRQYRESGWSQINDLPVEMSAMSVLTISSSSKPLRSVLRAIED